MCREQQRQHQRAEQAGPALLEAENEEFEEPAARSRLDRHRLEPRADPVEARMGAARLRHGRRPARSATRRSEEHTSELQSLMRISYAVFCLQKKKKQEHEGTTIKQ